MGGKGKREGMWEKERGIERDEGEWNKGKEKKRNGKKGKRGGGWKRNRGGRQKKKESKRVKNDF